MRKKIGSRNTSKTTYRQSIDKGARGLTTYAGLIPVVPNFSENTMPWPQSKPTRLMPNSALFQCAILAPTTNTQRWMSLCSGDKIIRRWEPATVRAFIIRVGGLFRTGFRQLKLLVPEAMLYETQWDAWLEISS